MAYPLPPRTGTRRPSRAPNDFDHHPVASTKLSPSTSPCDVRRAVIHRPAIRKPVTSTPVRTIAPCEHAARPSPRPPRAARSAPRRGRDAARDLAADRRFDRAHSGGVERLRRDAATYDRLRLVMRDREARRGQRDHDEAGPGEAERPRALGVLKGFMRLLRLAS